VGRQLPQGKLHLLTFAARTRARQGGFSLYAARGGAVEVTSLDLSKHALASAERNFALNAHVPAVAACTHRTVQADCFEWLAGAANSNYDVVILDPPCLAKRQVRRLPCWVREAGKQGKKAALPAVRRCPNSTVLVKYGPLVPCLST